MRLAGISQEELFKKMKSSKDKRIHGTWKILGTEGKFFIYQCNICKGKVLNGQPFSQVGMQDCG